MARRTGATNSPYQAGEFDTIVSIKEITGLSNDVTPVPTTRHCGSVYAKIERDAKNVSGDLVQDKDTVTYDHKIVLRTYWSAITPYKHIITLECVDYDVITVETIGRKVHTVLMVRRRS